MRKLGRWLLVIALSLSIGLQWAVVQGAAWVEMFVAYSKQANIIEALGMTFDGRHPCKLCKAARDGESKQTNRSADKPSAKLVLAAPQSDAFECPETATAFVPALRGVALARSLPPPLPPPEAA